MAHDRRARLRDAEGRFATPLRVALVLLVAVLGTTLAGAVGLVLERYAAQIAVGGLAVGAFAAALFVVAVRRLDRRPLRAYGLVVDRAWWTDLAAGAVIGIVAPALVFLGLLAAGVVEVVDVGSPGTREALWTGLLAAVVTYVAVGVWEELIFRGYVLTNVATGLARRGASRPIPWAVTIASLLFAAGHPAIVTSQAPVPLAASMFLLMGFVLGAAYVTTGRLALPIGLHITFNLVGNRLLPLVDLPAESERNAMLVRGTLEGPGWLVGEGGLGLLAAAVLVAVATWAWIRLGPVPAATDRSLLPTREVVAHAQHTDRDASRRRR